MATYACPPASTLQLHVEEVVKVHMALRSCYFHPMHRPIQRDGVGACGLRSSWSSNGGHPKFGSLWAELSRERGAVAVRVRLRPDDSAHPLLRLENPARGMREDAMRCRHKSRNEPKCPRISHDPATMHAKTTLTDLRYSPFYPSPLMASIQ